MTETHKHKRKASLIALEGLRDFVKSETPFEYSFLLVGISSRGIPQYQMLIEAEDEDFILVASKVKKTGPTIRILNLYPAVVTIHTEFGKNKPLAVRIDEAGIRPMRTL